jgi:hypothetical protein
VPTPEAQPPAAADAEGQRPPRAAQHSGLQRRGGAPVGSDVSAVEPVGDRDLRDDAGPGRRGRAFSTPEPARRLDCACRATSRRRCTSRR